MSPDAIVGMMMQRFDTNSDGNLSQEEVAGEERMKAGFGDYDTNKDGKIDRAELTAVIRKRMAANAGGGGPGGGPGAGGPGAGGPGRGPGASVN
jgi:Ca2+-binding EF-hand superfamily protein